MFGIKDEDLGLFLYDCKNVFVKSINMLLCY